MATLSALGKFSRLNILYGLCSSQHVTKVSRHCLSLLCPFYENSSKNQKLVYNFRQLKHSGPMERAYTTVSDDIKDLYGRRRDTTQRIATKAGKDVEMKAGMSRKTITTKKSVYEPSASGVAEAVWPSHCNVLVVGGGAVGSSIAYHLKEHARDGLSVVVVEEDPTVSQILSTLSYFHVFFLPYLNVSNRTCSSYIFHPVLSA